MASEDIIIVSIVSGIAFIAVLFVSGLTVMEYVCTSRGGGGRNCPRPHLCRREGRHVKHPPEWNPPKPPRWREGA